MSNRKAGILLPVSSIPSDYGIGGFSVEAKKFVDRLEKGGVRYWQILPLGPTGYGDSPYQSFSTFAGNPYLIDLETLISDGLLTREDIIEVCGAESPFAYPAISEQQAYQAPWDGLEVEIEAAPAVLHDSITTLFTLSKDADSSVCSETSQGSCSAAGPEGTIDKSADSDDNILQDSQNKQKVIRKVRVRIPGCALEAYKKGYNPNNYAEYGFLYETRLKILRKAFERFNTMTLGDVLDGEEGSSLKPHDSSAPLRSSSLYTDFLEANKHWLDDYALFMTIKNSSGGAGWNTWDEPLKAREDKALEEFRKEHQDDIDFQIFVQFIFDLQWKALKSYANEKGILIIGDIPIYVSFDSSDAWSHPELFYFDKDLAPIEVAGCPPDAFSDLGQLWGNPLYNWDYHKKTGYEWWLARAEKCFSLYDVVRLDHFRGFDEYYAIPAQDKDARNGKWKKGPGMELFNAINAKLGEVPIIAEDLGIITDSVRELLKTSGYPGMKILQFAFDASGSSCYLPHFFEDTNSVIYTGTHDNDTTKGWYRSLPDWDKKFIQDYFGSWTHSEDDITWDFIRLALMSISKLAIIPMQDFLLVGSEGRINTPATLGNNFKWRMMKDQFSEGLAEYINRLLFIYARLR